MISRCYGPLLSALPALTVVDSWMVDTSTLFKALAQFSEFNDGAANLNFSKKIFPCKGGTLANS